MATAYRCSVTINGREPTLAFAAIAAIGAIVCATLLTDGAHLIRQFLPAAVGQSVRAAALPPHDEIKETLDDAAPCAAESVHACLPEELLFAPRLLMHARPPHQVCFIGAAAFLVIDRLV